MRGKFLYAVLRQAVREWSENRVARMGAALAYYTIFSMAPLLVIATGIASLLFGEKAARGELAEQIRGIVTPQAAQTIEEMLSQAHAASRTVAATVSVVLSLVGASTVFIELQDALNSIWRVTPKPGRAWQTIVRERALSFVLILFTGFFLLISLVLSAALAGIARFLPASALPGGTLLWQLGHGLISFLLFTLLFALILKILPDALITWRDVWTGAIVTSLLFLIGRYLIGLYLGRSTVTSAFGAAGSFAAILIWVYYSSQIILFGAVFTRVYSSMRGVKPPPADNAIAVSPNEARESMIGK
ncbi:MAG TPA: YihY/virulence factor BrkB family protein [Gemmataceae bacterium]|jgi:membrane protein|nr:YihY/virulence factor BrkB family protein [Gemmataceae bacterium]